MFEILRLVRGRKFCKPRLELTRWIEADVTADHRFDQGPSNMLVSPNAFRGNSQFGVNVVHRTFGQIGDFSERSARAPDGSSHYLFFATCEDAFQPHHLCVVGGVWSLVS